MNGMGGGGGGGGRDEWGGIEEVKEREREIEGKNINDVREKIKIVINTNETKLHNLIGKNL